MKTIIFLAIIFVWTLAPAFGQSFSNDKQNVGTISGLILDSNKSVVVSAKILIESKGFKLDITSNEEGSYEVNLPEGKYKISVEYRGFYPFKKKSVRVRANSSIKFDITLKSKNVVVDERHP